MGLCVQVGMLADLLENDEDGAEWIRESLANVNAVLAENNLPKHDEPEQIPSLDDRSIISSFPYSFLHYLRRAYAHWKLNPTALITPCADGEDPTDDPAIEEVSCMFDSHLLCHSDCEGFYLPVEFSDVLIDETDQERIEGGLLGSSYKLAEELTEMAPSLGIQLVDGQLTDEAADSIRSNVESETELWIERGVWLTLFEAARLSIQHKTAICFC
jgi:hypothetical protein